jgi:glyoxylate/hydroxypyruvate reductase A
LSLAVLILCAGEDPGPWAASFRELDPLCDVRVWPDAGNPREILLALVWNHPRGELARYPNLRCIASMGAGVDHILSDPALPHGVPVTRVVHESLTRSMVEYVLLSVLDFSRDMEKYRQDQKDRRWAPRFPRPRGELGVGVMGLGELGGEAVRRLMGLGYNVLGWSRTPRSLEGAATFWGDGQLGDFLSRTNVLVCLLPLTAQTEGILNRETFSRLRPGAFLINVARGRHLVEEDLLEALDRGWLAGARLDVFRQEPLPPDHPFWSHPRIQVTPHISSLTEPHAVAPQILENYRRVCQALEPLHRVDPQRGY